MKSFIAKPKIVKHDWYVIDATDKILGRLASELAYRLQGKHKPEYTPHIDTGDYIIVLNAEKVFITGNKFYNKIYYYHTGRLGGLKKISFKELITIHPDRVIKLAVKRMLPKGPLGRVAYRKLKIYINNEHKHTAQKPRFLNV